MARKEATLSYDDIAALANISPATVRKYRSTGHLPPPDASPHPSVPRWKRQTITSWLDNRPGRGRGPRPNRRKSA